MIVDDGIKTMAGIIGSSVVNRPSHYAVGTGSSTVTAGDIALLTETDRNAVSSIDLSVAKDITYIADFSAPEMSGTTITEFGLFNAASNGSMFHREVVTAIEFAGDRELQIQTTLRFAKA